ncbi:MAG: hypothetical protein V8S24_06075, partial [Gordonibacter pamelaeae]
RGAPGPPGELSVPYRARRARGRGGGNWYDAVDEEKLSAMIYFDNAATTRAKPPEVAEAVARAIGSFGGVGRGVHPASIAAGMAVYGARAAVARICSVRRALRAWRSRPMPPWR